MRQEDRAALTPPSPHAAYFLFSIQCCFNSNNERLQILSDRIPYQVMIDNCVTMYDPVPHPRDRRPRKRWDQRTGSGRDAACRFTDDLNEVLKCQTQNFIAVIIAATLIFNELARFDGALQHVSEIQRIIML